MIGVLRLKVPPAISQTFVIHYMALLLALKGPIDESRRKSLIALSEHCRINAEKTKSPQNHLDCSLDTEEWTMLPQGDFSAHHESESLDNYSINCASFAAGHFPQQTPKFRQDDYKHIFCYLHYPEVLLRAAKWGVEECESVESMICSMLEILIELADSFAAIQYDSVEQLKFEMFVEAGTHLLLFFGSSHPTPSIQEWLFNFLSKKLAERRRWESLRHSDSSHLSSKFLYNFVVVLVLNPPAFDTFSSFSQSPVITFSLMKRHWLKTLHLHSKPFKDERRSCNDSTFVPFLFNLACSRKDTCARPQWSSPTEGSCKWQETVSASTFTSLLVFITFHILLVGGERMSRNLCSSAIHRNKLIFAGFI